MSAELLLRVSTGGRGVVATLVFLTGRGREGLVRHASCRREREGLDAKLGVPQRGQSMWPLKSGFERVITPADYLVAGREIETFEWVKEDHERVPVEKDTVHNVK